MIEEEHDSTNPPPESENEETEKESVNKEKKTPSPVDTEENVEIVEDTDEEVEILDLSDEVDKYADIDLDDEEQLKSMLKDFSDIEDLSIEEMMEIQNAIDDVKEDTEGSSDTEEISIVEPISEQDPYEGWGIYDEIRPEFKPDISEDLETLIQEELEKKRIKKKIVTEEEFKEKCSRSHSKIWYHALWTLVFDMEDHQARKETLYELLKDLTSKSPIDPLPEHKFYFGLSFILALTLNGKRIIEFRGDKLKLNVGIDILNDILHEVGQPISERPIIPESEKKKMYSDFLTDNFDDI